MWTFHPNSILETISCSSFWRVFRGSGKTFRFYASAFKLPHPSGIFINADSSLGQILGIFLRFFIYRQRLEFLWQFRKRFFSSIVFPQSYVEKLDCLRARSSFFASFEVNWKLWPQWDNAGKSNRRTSSCGPATPVSGGRIPLMAAIVWLALAARCQFQDISGIINRCSSKSITAFAMYTKVSAKRECLKPKHLQQQKQLQNVSNIYNGKNMESTCASASISSNFST